jgi:hypothetical protein
MAYSTFQQQAIYQSVEDLSVWLVPHVGQWPKWLRPTLGHHTMEALMGVLRSLVTAYGVPKAEKLQHLRMASADLWEYRKRLEGFLWGLGLLLNPKTTIAPTAQGVPFLGLRVFPDHRRVLRPNVVRGRRRLRGSLRALSAGDADRENVAASTGSWIAHLRHADTYRLRIALAAEYEPYLGVV